MRIVFSLFLVLFVAGCNLPRPTQQSPSAQIATQASSFLTASAMPVLRISPSTAFSQTAVLPTGQVPSTPTTTPSPTVTISPTRTPTSTPTQATPTQSRTPTPTPLADDPRQALGNPTWKDTLSSGKSFYLYKDEHIEVKVESDALVMTGFKADGWHGWSLTHNVKAQNFYIEGSYKTRTCSGNDSYGLVFRAPSDESGYFATITCDGRYKVHKWDGSKSTEIIALAAAPAIKPGSNQVNRFGVKAAGQTFTIYANGVKIKEFNDATYPNEGYIGAFVAAVKTAGFTVEMDEIAYWKLP